MEIAKCSIDRLPDSDLEPFRKISQEFEIVFAVELSDNPHNTGDGVLGERGQYSELRSLCIDLDQVRSSRADLEQDVANRPARNGDTYAFRGRAALKHRVSAQIPLVRRCNELGGFVAGAERKIEAPNISVGRNVALKQNKIVSNRLKRENPGSRIDAGEINRGRADIAANIENGCGSNESGNPILCFSPSFKENGVNNMYVARADAVVDGVTIPPDTA